MEIERARTRLPLQAPRPALKYQTLTEELLRQLRGGMSQRGLSRLLGFSFNQVGKWESGVTQMKFADFLRLGDALKIPMEKHFRFSFWNLSGIYTEENCLRALNSNLNATSLGTKSLTQKMKSWLTSASKPNLCDILEVIDQRRSVLVMWLSLFVDCQKLNCLRAHFELYQLSVETLFHNPRVVYVSEALNLNAYKKQNFHDENLVAEHCDCTAAEVRETLHTLQAAGLVYFDGVKFQAYPFNFSFSSSRNPKLRGLTKLSSELAASRYSLMPTSAIPAKVINPGWSAVRVIAMSKATAQKANELLSRCNAALAELVELDTGPKDNVQVVLMHSFPSNINAPQFKQKPGADG